MTIETRYFENFIDDLKSLINIPSILSEAESNMPFGKNIDLALDEMLSIAKKLGFTTYKDPDGFYGYADIGSGKPIIGILGHIDVVPAGDLNKWTSPPFTATVLGNKIYGRGTQDDKGPTLAALYAVKILMDQGINFKKKIRFIFGTDEENLWRGIGKYSQNEIMPEIGFSPDSRFPLIYAEKGLLQCVLSGVNKTDLRFSGGDAYNSVPSKMTVKRNMVPNLIRALDNFNFDYSSDDESITILGKSVHAQVAETGINSISRLCMALDSLCIQSKVIDFVANEVQEDAFAENIFGSVSDEISGKLKFNIGKIDFNETKESIFVDIRIPVTFNKDLLIDQLESKCHQYGLTLEIRDYLDSKYLPLESPLIQELMNAYQSITGDTESLPISSGGATYARAFDQCVAFGAVFPNRPKTEHQPNEYILLDDIKIAMAVYKKAIENLLEL